MRTITRFKARALRVRQVRGTALWVWMLAAGLYLFGILAGALCEEGGRAQKLYYAQYFVEQILQIHSGASFSEIAGFLFLSTLLLQTAILFFSLSCVGAPVILIIPLLKGFTDGCVAGYLYGVLGAQGIVIYLLLFFLPQVGQAVLMLCFLSRAMPLSISLFRTNLLHKSADGKQSVDATIRLFLFTALGLIAVSLLGALFSTVLAPALLTPHWSALSAFT